VATTTHRDPVQRRTVATLSMSQILGGVSLASGVAVGALLAEQVSGSPTYAGLGSTFQVLGSAIIAVPLARLSAARGRRPGLALGYALSFVGALGLIASGIIGRACSSAVRRRPTTKPGMPRPTLPTRPTVGAT